MREGTTLALAWGFGGNGGSFFDLELGFWGFHGSSSVEKKYGALFKPLTYSLGSSLRTRKVTVLSSKVTAQPGNLQGGFEFSEGTSTGWTRSKQEQL